MNRDRSRSEMIAGLLLLGFLVALVVGLVLGVSAVTDGLDSLGAHLHDAAPPQ